MWSAKINGSTAKYEELGEIKPVVTPKAAGMRYVRALRRLKEILSSLDSDWLEP